MNKIRIHKDNGLHGLGIEYNYTIESKDDDATDFVQACRVYLDKNHHWFHQSGSNNQSRDEDWNITYSGYQFFEMWVGDELDLIDQACVIAEEIDAEIVFE